MLTNIKRQKEGKEFFDEESANGSSLKSVGTNIRPGICCLLNGFQNPARKPAGC